MMVGSFVSCHKGLGSVRPVLREILDSVLCFGVIDKHCWICSVMVHNDFLNCDGGGAPWRNGEHLGLGVWAPNVEKLTSLMPTVDPMVWM